MSADKGILRPGVGRVPFTGEIYFLLSGRKKGGSECLMFATFFFFFKKHLFLAASGLSCTGFSLAEALGLVGPGILVPRPGMEPTSPALGGGFLTPGPPGKS